MLPSVDDPITAAVRSGKSTLIQGRETVTHLQSYTNSAIADICVNHQYRRTEHQCRCTDRRCRRNECQCRIERRCRCIERQYRHMTRIERRVFECFMMFHNVLRVFYDVSLVVHDVLCVSQCFMMFNNVLRCLVSYQTIGSSACTIFNAASVSGLPHNCQSVEEIADNAAGINNNAAKVILC